jgi:hypothetical protein
MTVERQTRPDFRIFKDNEPVFYLEAVLAAPSNADVSTEKIKNRIYDALNQRLNSPNFLIAIQRAKGASTIDPPIKPLIRLLEERLNSLDPDAVARQMEQGGWRALPFWTWQHEEWEISFRAIPKLPQMRGKPGVRPVGSYMKSGWVEPQEGIRGAIRKKATKYGELDLPYIIAVNALEEFVEQDAAVEALFGDECIVATPYMHESGLIKSEWHPSRKRNGAFWGPQGWQNTRVSGVMMLCRLLPWSVATQEPVLWHHPQASQPLLPDAWSLPQRILDLPSGKWVKRGGIEIAKVFGLLDNWPRKA